MGKVEWYEIICAQQVDDNLIRDIKWKLMQQGFLPDSIKYQNYPEIKCRGALLEFQKNKHCLVVKYKFRNP